MAKSCNRGWQTVDTVEMLYLEAVRLALSPEWQDLFGLPMVEYARNLLRFKIGKVLHRRQMCTRWHSYPKDIQDRDDGLDNVYSL